MLRAVLLGSLAMSIASVACSSHGAAPAAQPGAPAGTVLHVAGTVTARRGASSRRLAQGDTVAADDLIDTGSDGSIDILLAHNHVDWQLEAGMQEKPIDSAAWKQPVAQAPAKPVDEDTTSAGRPGERSAADTAATAKDTAAAAPAPATTPAATGTAAPSPEVRQAAAPRPPPKTAVRERKVSAAPAAHAAAQSARADVDSLVGAGAGPRPVSPTTPQVQPASPNVVLEQLLRAHLADFQACLAPGKHAVGLRVEVDASGKVTEGADGSAAEQACMAKVIATLQLPASATATIRVPSKP